MEPWIWTSIWSSEVAAQRGDACYRRSRRQLPRKLSPFGHPAHYEVRLVSTNGGLRWRCRRVNVTTTLMGEYVGLEEVGDGLWDAYFCRVRLGRLDERRMRIEDKPGRWIRGKQPTEVSPMSLD
jgi:hypothetical protein